MLTRLALTDGETIPTETFDKICTRTTEEENHSPTIYSRPDIAAHARV